MPDITLSADQEAAILKFKDFMDRGEKVFRLFGPAGCGKTFLSRILSETFGCDQSTVYCAYTGKAASRMAAAGCKGARTLHSHLYKLDGTNKWGDPEFVLGPTSELVNADLVVLDECSMISDEVARDLVESTKGCILVLGDPYQLPPIEGVGEFTIRHQPDHLLTHVHRQALESPILQWADRIRTTQRWVDPKDHVAPGLSCIARDKVDALEYDQILVGTNDTRKKINKHVRARHGYDQPLCIGETLVCTKNNRRIPGMFNGTLWTVKAVQVRQNGKEASVHLVDDQGNEARGTVNLEALQELDTDFAKKWVPYHLPFQYGYALTVHKAQGSQWDKVLLLDESRKFREHQSRWLYTAATRAAKELHIT